MPIEIRELIIRATVNEIEPAASAEAAAGQTAGLSEDELEQIIGECVRQVMAILAEKIER